MSVATESFVRFQILKFHLREVVTLGFGPQGARIRLEASLQSTLPRVMILSTVFAFHGDHSPM